MEERPKTPIIAISNAGADVDVFSDVRATLSYVEAIDVLHGEYDFYDVEGFPLRASVDKWTVIGLSRVPAEPPDQATVIDRLRREITRIGADRVGLSTFGTAGLAELAEALLVSESRFQAEHSLSPAAVLRGVLRLKHGNRT